MSRWYIPGGSDGATRCFLPRWTFVRFVFERCPISIDPLPVEISDALDGSIHALNITTKDTHHYSHDRSEQPKWIPPDDEQPRSPLPKEYTLSQIQKIRAPVPPAFRAKKICALIGETRRLASSSSLQNPGRLQAGDWASKYTLSWLVLVCV
jgi:hypothetical protein